MRQLRSHKPPVAGESLRARPCQWQGGSSGPSGQTSAICIAAFLCLPFLSLHAQQKHPQAASVPSATIKATVDKEKIVIGEPIRLQLEVTVADNIPFAWPGLDSLPHFEWLDTGNVDTTVLPGERTYRQSLTVTSFDSGMWAIPRLPFLVAGKKIFSDSIRIAVGYTRIDSLKDFHDIKDIIDIPNPFARWIGWIVAATTLLSLTFVYLFVRKKKWLKKLVETFQQPRLAPYEEAMQQLDELQRQALSDAAATKTQYSRLGEILRVYLLRRLNISSFAETSEELIRDLRRQQLPLGTFDALAEALRTSDFVKFAKYQPGVTDSEQHAEAVRSAIRALEDRKKAQENETSDLPQTNKI